MRRKDLLEVLKKVEPALSSRDIIPILSCFCFSDGFVTTYDDLVALVHPLKDAPLIGGVRGKLLLSFLGASKAEEVEVESKKQNAEVKLGRARLKIPVLPKSDFIFDLKDLPKATEIKIKPDFLDALAQVFPSMGKDPADGWRLGITLAAKGDRLFFYATDNKSASRKSIKIKSKKKVEVILPPRFCELLLDISGKDPARILKISKRLLEVTFKSGMRLFSRTCHGVSVETYEKMFASMERKVKGYVQVPKGLDRCLERAEVVIPYAKNQFTEFSIDGDRMKMVTEAAAGRVQDSILVGKHEKVSEFIPPTMIRKSLRGVAEFCIVPDSYLVLKGPGVCRIIAVVHV